MLEYAKKKVRGGQGRPNRNFRHHDVPAAPCATWLALGHPYGIGDRISRLIPIGSQGLMTLDRAMEMTPELACGYL